MFQNAKLPLNGKINDNFYYLNYLKAILKIYSDASVFRKCVTQFDVKVEIVFNRINYLGFFSIVLRL